MEKQQIRTELEAGVFRGLVKHLQHRVDVQNIELMNLAGFCAATAFQNGTWLRPRNTAST